MRVTQIVIALQTCKGLLRQAAFVEFFFKRSENILKYIQPVFTGCMLGIKYSGDVRMN